ncbi:MAG: hypothetical protein ACUVWX_01035 [Kiritimatiellia bacterium]
MGAPGVRGHAGGAGTDSRTFDRPIHITVFSPATGKELPRQGPAWGTPEARLFWKKLTDGFRSVLAKRGMEESLLFGLIGDCRPTKQAMDDMTYECPLKRWAVHSHYYCTGWNGYEIGFAIALWGIGCTPVDPTQGYGYGWANPFWRAYYPRGQMYAPLAEYRTKTENWMGAVSRSATVYAKAAGAHGLGRLGADFWRVLQKERANYQGGFTLAGRFPESYWGQLNMNYGVPYVLGQGRKGPVPTVRSEALRENLEEVEARVFLEKALLDPEARTMLGEEMTRQIRQTLDERIRMALYADGEGELWFISSGWAARSEKLFGLAGEVSRKLGGRTLVPELQQKTEKMK